MEGERKEVRPRDLCTQEGHLNLEIQSIAWVTWQTAGSVLKAGWLKGYSCDLGLSWTVPIFSRHSDRQCSELQPMLAPVFLGASLTHLRDGGLSELWPLFHVLFQGYGNSLHLFLCAALAKCGHRRANICSPLRQSYCPTVLTDHLGKWTED